MRTTGWVNTPMGCIRKEKFLEISASPGVRVWQELLVHKADGDSPDIDSLLFNG
jgi:hypothetical protein